MPTLEIKNEFFGIETNIEMILKELFNATEKYPKFCEKFTSSLMPWDNIERRYKIINSESPFFASDILEEEVAEAMVAYQQGDREHCLQELAQCGAVILRMMKFVQDELLTCSTGPQPATPEA